MIMKYVFYIDLHLDIYIQIYFSLGMCVGATKLKNLILVSMTFVFAQGQRVANNLELVLSILFVCI